VLTKEKGRKEDRKERRKEGSKEGRKEKTHLEIQIPNLRK
jgi:hypothetical protein